MYKLAESAIIAKSPAEVFQAAADPVRQLEWDPGTLKHVEKLTPGPLGPGTRYRGVFSGMGTVEYEFADYEPGRRFSHFAAMPFGTIRHIFDLEAAPEGCRLTQSMVVEPKGLGVLMTPILKAMLRKRIRVINAEIQAYLEVPAAITAS